jgi:hypothetical protein
LGGVEACAGAAEQAAIVASDQELEAQENTS